MALDELLTQCESLRGIPPVDRWSPSCRGDLDLTIARAGRWFHEGAPFTNDKVRRLLSRLLRREADGAHYLVVPHEKWRISVEDRAFSIIDADCHAGCWTLTTDVGDRVVLDGRHRLRLADAETAPVVEVRFGLEARLNRNVFYRLVEQAQTSADGTEVGLVSAGAWQPLGRLSAESS